MLVGFKINEEAYKMKEHLLLEKAYIYPVEKTYPKMEGCEFDGKKGYWVISDSGVPLILHNEIIGPRTKKCDIETGEDQKGE